MLQSLSPPPLPHNYYVNKSCLPLIHQSSLPFINQSLPSVESLQKPRCLTRPSRKSFSTVGSPSLVNQSGGTQLSLFSIPSPSKSSRKPRKIKSVTSTNHVQLNLFTDTVFLSPDENLLLHFWLALINRDSEYLLKVNLAMTQYWTDLQYQTVFMTVKPFLKEEEEFFLIQSLKAVI